MTSSKLGVVAAIGAMMLFVALSWTAPAQGQGGDKSASTFKSKCAVCHGAGGKGDTPAGKSLGAADLTKVAATKSASELKTVIQNGKGKMPAYGKGLKPEEIDAMIAYIKSLK
jgi:mono/diheme cytochrome c family protein